MSWVSYESRQALFDGAARCIVKDLQAALDRKDRASLAVPGGTTPGPVFDVLAQTSLDWERIDVMLTDERWVPETHERSNTALVRARLMTGFAANARFFPFYSDGEAEIEVPKRAEALTKILPLDVVVLGMGGDMHTASLFPGAPGLEAALAPDAPNLCVLKPESQPDIRVSLSGPALAGARAKHLLITGDDKKRAWQQSETFSVYDAPIRVVSDGLQIHWSE